MTQQIVHQLQISGPNGDQTFELSTGTAITGRQLGVDLQLEHKLISRRHASFTCTEEQCIITDLKSSNGTKVNETRLAPNEPHPLKDGDVIEMGPFKLTYIQIKLKSESEEKMTAPLTPEPEPVEFEPVAEEAEQIALKPEPERPFVAEAPPPPIQPPDTQSETPPPYQPPPGLSINRSEYLKYLPDIYHTDFMARFLAMFESIYMPMRWNVDNFDVFLNPRTAPDGFFPWLASWFELTFDNSWNDEQRITLLAEANELFARRGTKKALSRILEIYTTQTPIIDDTNKDLEPFTFTVNLPLKKSEVNVALIEALINQHKPAYTNYNLKLKR